MKNYPLENILMPKLIKAYMMLGIITSNFYHAMLC